jgi:catechol 2,3-dioxygenase-like lactoylglutathione lyase family enzyme
MATEITGWHHITYPVPDVEASEAWYCRILNGEVMLRTGWSERDVRAQRNRQIWIRAGASVTNLAEGPKVERPPGTHFYHYAMEAPKDQLDDWIAHLEREGVEVLGPYGHGGVGLLSLYFDDPDGYRLEIIFDFEEYEVAKAEAISRGGALGNPDAQYDWE